MAIRTWLLSLGLIVAVGIATASGLAAVGASPGTNGRGIETLQITVTDGGYAIRPQVEPGRYEVVIENLSNQDVSLELVLARWGWTVEQQQAAVASSTEVVYAGSASAHGRGHIVVDLAAGNWFVRAPGVGSGYAAVIVVSAVA